ncbi:MAG: K+-sensing histidine kinase KdpD [Halioglobus sp.]|jgi:K+-sensing histidine kinase KdpD
MEYAKHTAQIGSEFAMTPEKSNLAFQIHDLRNKIGAAVSFVELLENEQPLVASSPHFASVRECLVSAIKTSREVSTALDSTVSEQVRAEVQTFQLVSAIEVVSVHALEAYAVLNRQYPIDIQYSYTILEQDRLLAMDQGEVSSIRENVIANAVASGATRLKVIYEMRDYCLVINMEDDGCGMSEDELNKLQLRQLGDGQIHGLGTRRIMSSVVAHDSAVTYSSREGVGTTVKILCPYENPVD